MKVGDLVRYRADGDIGLVVAVKDGYYTVIFPMSSMEMDDLIYSELELINESR